MDSLRTAYSTAYSRMLLLIKGGRVGDVVSVDATCTNLKTNERFSGLPEFRWNSMAAWGPTALLPIFQILGVEKTQIRIASRCSEKNRLFDDFSRISIDYVNAVASAKVGAGAKSEGDLVISGTKGYVYIPAPWWKTEYFEIRYENPADNRRYFFQLEGEGIRFEWVQFLRMIAEVAQGENSVEVYCRESGIERKVSRKICEVMSLFERGENVTYLEVPL